MKTAGRILERIAPALVSTEIINHMNSSSSSTTPPIAIHSVGRSLSESIAGLDAAISDGIIPMPPDISEEKLSHPEYIGFNSARITIFLPSINNNIARFIHTNVTIFTPELIRCLYYFFIFEKINIHT
jgi:hypothetical protein